MQHRRQGRAYPEDMESGSELTFTAAALCPMPPAAARIDAASLCCLHRSLLRVLGPDKQPGGGVAKRVVLRKCPHLHTAKGGVFTDRWQFMQQPVESAQQYVLLQAKLPSAHQGSLSIHPLSSVPGSPGAWRAA